MRHVSIAYDIKRDGGFTPLPRWESLAAAIPGATIEIMEGCGHVMFHEHPAEFNQRAIRFLADSVGTAIDHVRRRCQSTSGRLSGETRKSPMATAYRSRGRRLQEPRQTV